MLQDKRQQTKFVQTLKIILKHKTLELDDHFYHFVNINEKHASIHILVLRMNDFP